MLAVQRGVCMASVHVVMVASFHRPISFELVFSSSSRSVLDNDKTANL